MAKFPGGLTGTLHDSPEARDHYERHALAHAWNALEAYETMDPAKRKRFEDALDANAADSMGASAIAQFVAEHPEMEDERNAHAMRRYFADRAIHPPYDLFKLRQAYAELKGEDVLVGIPERKRNGG